MDYITILEELSKTLKQTIEYNEAKAAVVVLLRFNNQNLELLLVKRAIDSKDPWSGQTALPGGRRNPKDQNIKETMIRETKEETNINVLEGSQFIGAMETTKSFQNPVLTIVPFVVFLKKKQNIKLNEELSEYLWITFGELENNRSFVEINNTEYPAFILGNHVIWGLTHKILNNLLLILSTISK